MSLFEKHKADSLTIQRLVCLYALGSVAAHAAYAVKYDSIARGNTAHKLLPFLAVKLCACIFFLYYNGIGKLSENVPYLPLNVLLSCAYSAIAVYHV